MSDLTSRRTVRPQEFTHDLYAPIAHLIGDGSPATTVAPGLVPQWADPVDARRMLAYRALGAIRDNARRFWLAPELWHIAPVVNPSTGQVSDAGRSPAEQFREYGHAGLIVDTARALVLGDEQVIRVPDAAPLPEPDGDEPSADRAAAEATQARAAALEEWLDGWADAVGLPTKLLDAEETTISQGDSAFVLSWSPGSARPRLRVYDGGFCFPDWDAIDRDYYVAAGWDDEDFPPVFSLAWEHERAGVTWLRRTTWSLRLAADLVPGQAPAVRERPWGASPWTCWYEVSEWRLDRMKSGRTLHELDPGSDGGRRVVEPMELPIDFLPIVHLPNDYPGGRRFGRSIFLRIAQLLDDLGGGDTDLAINAETVASSSLVTTGISGVQAEGGPGAHFELPAGGTAGLIDTSRSLDALLKYGERLLETLAINSRLGPALLGRIKPNEVPSGTALRLGFAPAQRLLQEMRLVRSVKLALIPKMAVRLAQAAGVLEAGPTPRIEVELGASLPADRAAIIEEVHKLLGEHAISTVTAVRMLIAAGLPIDDAEDEVARIRSEDTEGADQLVNATGRTADAYAYLGLEPAPDPVIPEPDGGVLPAPTLPAP